MEPADESEPRSAGLQKEEKEEEPWQPGAGRDGGMRSRPGWAGELGMSVAVRR